MLFGDSKQNKRRKAGQQRRKKQRRDQQDEQRRAKARARRRTRPVAGLAAGLVGGLVATWVLDNYNRGAAAAARDASSDPDGTLPTGISAVPSIPLMTPKPQLRYLTGAVAGAIYGISVELVPMARSGYGTGFASLLFLGGPEVLAPFLPPGAMPPAAVSSQGAGSKKQPGGLSAHLVFGATLETVRRMLRWFL